MEKGGGRSLPAPLVVRGAPAGAGHAGRIAVGEGFILLRSATGDPFTGETEDASDAGRHSPHFLSTALAVSDETQH